MTITREFCIAVDHPCLAGHFPGRPLVPAVLILQRALGALGDGFPGCRVTGLSQAKFISPLAPGERAQLRLERLPTAAIGFECRVGERCIANGRFAIEEAGEHP